MDILNQGLLALVPIFIKYLIIAYFGAKIIDFITGILKTWKNGNYRSAKMRDGIIRWIAEMVAIVFVIGVDLLLGLNWIICGLTLGLFVYKECGSIIENLGECDVYLPQQLKDKLEVLNPQNKKEVK